MIHITNAVYTDIIEYAQSKLPIESCGYLAGKDNVITRSYHLTNLDNSPQHFSFDPAEQFQTVKQARSEGLQILANFHSHPETPARPSEEDIRLAFDSNILYVIISFAAKIPVVKAFAIHQGNVTEIEIRVE